MDAEQLLNEFRTQVEEQVRQAQELETTVLKMRVTTTSPCGSVKLTIQPNGAISGIELTKRACDLSPKKLSALITATHLKAHREMTRKVESAFAGLDQDAAEMMDVLIGERVPSYRDKDVADNVSSLWRGTEDDNDEFTERPW